MAETVVSYQDVVSFRPDRFNPVVVAETERVRALVVCFEPGQFIPVHSAGADMVLTVLEGRGTLVVGDRAEPIAPGTVAFVPAGEARGVRAEGRLVTLQVVSPPPTAADHGDVARKLGQGEFR